MNRRTVGVALGVVVLVVALGAAVTLSPPWAPDDGGAAADETPRLVYEGERLALEAAPDQTIRGQTDLEQGTELSVRVRSTAEIPFLKTRPATVDDSPGRRAAPRWPSSSTGTARSSWRRLA